MTTTMAMSDDRPALLLTRPRADSEAFLRDLRARVTPGPVVISPVMRIEATGDLPEMADVAGVIFTSKNGVRAAPAGGGLPAYCVGVETTALAQQHGYAAEMAGEDAAAFVPKLSALRPEGRLLHLRGRHARGNVAGRLVTAGLRVEAAIIYDQHPCALSAEAHALLAGERPVILPLFSPRSADILAAEAPRARAPLWVVAISVAAADHAKPLGAEKTLVTAHPDAMSIAEAVTGLYGAGSSLEGT